LCPSKCPGKGKIGWAWKYGTGKGGRFHQIFSITVSSHSADQSADKGGRFVSNCERCTAERGLRKEEEVPMPTNENNEDGIPQESLIDQISYSSTVHI
jgi:hypothetical protein